MSEKKSFKQSMKRIDEILALLEKNEIELEESIELFEEGLKLVKECDLKLKGFESKMDELIESYQGEDHE